MDSAKEISLAMPAELGAVVVATDSVQERLRETDEIRVSSIAVDEDVGGAFRDFGATAVAILGAPAVVLGVRRLFDVIRVAIREAHKTRRLQYSQRTELAKLLLTLHGKEATIDLKEDLATIEKQLDNLEQQASQAV